MPSPTGAETLGKDSPAKGLGTKQNPRDRQYAHAEKQRAQLARQVGTPGPGAYSPARPASTVAGSSSKGGSAGSSASFASKSKRSDFSKQDLFMGDPGAYDPDTHKTLAARSKKSVSKNNKNGSGSFGGQEQRKLAVDLLGEGTPGPGAYNGERMMRTGKVAALSAMDSSEKMPMSSFHSKAAQRGKTPNQHVPGAGAYSPAFSAIEKNALNPANGMRGKASRFKGADTWERAQATEPGPGAYEIQFLRTGSKSSLSAVSQTTHSRGEAAFGTESLRELPWEC
jgi:hypothetical protein